MRIVTLIENLVYTQDLYAEHGLAFYIETSHRKILFDTGQSDKFLKNAQTLSIDIMEIDTVVISHGHFDHTGGLYPFLMKNKKARVYIKKEAFLKKYHGNKRFIGFAYEPELLDGRIEYITRITEIDTGVFILPDIPIVNQIDTNFCHFKIRNPNGFENDEFQDELYLAIICNNELSIVSSCSHRGITNIVNATICHFKLPVNLILGGFHIKDCGISQYNAITNYFKEISPKSIGVCHCTGIEKYVDLLYQFNHKVFYNFTGNTIII